MKKLQRNQQGFAHIGLILLVIVVVAVGGFTIYRITDNDTADNNNEASVSSQQNQAAETTVEDSEQEAEQETNETTMEVEKSKIKGTMSFASERVPGDYRMCAVGVNDTADEVCTSEVVGEDNEFGGQYYFLFLDVEPGDYYVYAKSDESNSKHLAYYVDCDEYDCDNASEQLEAPVSVTIPANGIELTSLYAVYESFNL